MRTFKDLSGQSWTLAITVATVRNVRAAFDGLDLLDIGDPKSGVLERIFGDVILFVDLLYFLVRDQAIALEISDEAFGQVLGGDVLLEAQKSFMESLADFTPQPDRRKLLREILKKGRELEQILLQTNLKKLETMNIQHLADAFIADAGNSPASPDVIPFPDPSAS